MTAGDTTASASAPTGASKEASRETPEEAPMPSRPHSKTASPYLFDAPPAALDGPAAASLRAAEGESQLQRDKRVEELWKRLDPQGDRELDLKGLKKGLRRIDHPMKNADDMLREIIDIVDVNGDGKIQFEEFRVFVEAAERQLLILFRSIDRNDDGRLNKAELRAAFQKSGLAVPARRLDGFFDEIDMNHDGFITFDEWRDFLLFIPTLNNGDGTDPDSGAALKTALSYYASIVILNAEGDSMVSDETLEGLGTATSDSDPDPDTEDTDTDTSNTNSGFLLQALFGSILKLAKPKPSVAEQLPTETTTMTTTDDVQTLEDGTDSERQIRKRKRIRPPIEVDTSTSSIPPVPSSPTAPSPPPPPLPPDSQEGAVVSKSKKKSKSGSLHESETGEGASKVSMSSAAAGGGTSKGAESTPAVAGRGHEYEDYEDLDDVDELDEVLDSDSTQTIATGSGTKLQRAQRASPTTTSRKSKSKSKKLTQYVPHPGYFLAGALAGGISRTATAPFDRLKVYLLVNTRGGSSAAAVKAAVGESTSTPAAASAVRKTGRPIRDAIVNLYRAGGLRTFFAGNGLNVVKIMPETAIKFGSYEAAKRTLAAFEGHGDPLRINSSSKFVAGGVAGMIAQFCVYPLDTLKFRLQCETVQGGPTGNALLIQTARRMYATGGVRAAYRGVTMGLIGMFPYSAIDMGTFELLKGTYMKYKARYYGIHEEDAAPGNVVTGIIGATSGAFGATVVYPLNVLRTRLQTQGTVMHPPTYTGIWDVATRTVANEGVRGLYKGLTPNLLKVAPALSITWVVYENSKKALGLP